MVVTKKQILSESEVNRIRGLYGINPIKQEEYVFEACISADERYFIMNDDVFDVQEKKLVGNLWESMDVFKTIFQNVKIVDEEFQDIRESIINLPITESREDLQLIKKFMLENKYLDKLKGWGNDFMNKTWVGKELKSAGEGIADFVTKSWEGLKQFGVAISKGDWSEIMSLLGRGVLWVLRKLKNAMYSNLGMIVDAVLIATGVGKGVQWIPWALITALDLYQLINNDYPEDEKDNPMWLKLLFLGFDILGLVSAGAIAKAARLEAEGLKAIASKPGMVAKFLKNSPRLRGFIESILNGAKKVPEMLDSAVSSIAKKAPKVANFIKGITGGLSRILKELGESLSKLLGKSGTEIAKTTAKTGAGLYAFDKASDMLLGTGEGGGENMGTTGSEMAGLSDNEKQTIELFNQTYTPITVQAA